MPEAPASSSNAPSTSAPEAEAAGRTPSEADAVLPASGTEHRAKRSFHLTRLQAFETALLVAGIVLFLVLLYEMEVPPVEGSFLNPPLVAAAGTILLWPLRRHRSTRALLLSGGFLILLWFVNQAAVVLAPFVVVYLLAYLLNPALRRLDQWGLPRWAGALGLTTVVVGSLVAIVLVLAPSAIAQVETLSQRVLEGVGALRSWLASTSVLDTLEAGGLVDKREVLRQFTGLIQEQAGRIPEAARRVAASLGSVLGVITTLALVPVLLFYTLKDFPSIRDALLDLFPTANGRRDYLLDAGGIVGSYLRGQLIISSIAAFNISVALALFDVPFWLLIGLVGGLLNFIPNLGAIITMLVGVLVALIFGGWVKVLVVVVVLVAQALLEQSVLTPNILGYQVGMHPVLVLFSLLIFGAFLGLFGLLIAVPATAILVTGYKAYREELTLELGDYAARPRPRRRPARPRDAS